MIDIEKATKTVHVGELKFPVLDQGTGDVVLLLHGFPDSRHLWRYQIPALLNANFRVLAPDLRGFGDAPKPRDVEGYAVPNVTREVIGLLDALEVDDFYLVGHDWGAVVAWFTAAHHPERVKRLVALSVGCPGNSGTTSYEQLSRAWYAFLFANAGHVENLVRANDWEFARRLLRGHGDQERYFDQLSRPGALEAALNWYRANMVLDFDPEKRFSLPKIQCPVLGVWSDGDDYLAEPSVERSAECVDGPWRYEKMAGASHWMMLEKPEELNALMVSFLQG
jgi:pimeloyl-ACP methyl ester carboxylesterase